MPRYFLLLFCAVFAFAQSSLSPDRTPLADEWGYRPADGSTSAVNPPSLTWVHEKAASSYTLQWSATPDFGKPVTISRLRWTVYTHHETLAAGEYYWRYRIHGASGEASAWSRARRFRVTAEAVAFPQPTLAQLKTRIRKEHPRLFVSNGDLDRLRAYAKGEGKQAFARLIGQADRLITATPTAEPTVMGDSRNPETRDHWWSNRVQTVKALQEGEVLSFAWLLTQDRKYAEPARSFALKLAAWNPDGPTKFALNCEAAKPMVHRLARVYDWSYGLLSDEERAMFRKVLLRRAQDAWISGEVREGTGHLNQPYGSHANRTWHKLAENAVATLGETPESDLFLDYAVTKFFAAYPVWSDEDGGWHEGLSYFAGYMSKAAWWMHLSGQALGIDGFRKPFFAHFGDYAMYSAPPGSPELGYGDLSHSSVSRGWAFMTYYIQQTKNPHWAWWAKQWNLPEDVEEPVLSFLWSAMGRVTPQKPTSLPPSKVFRGTGIAVLNTTIESAAENVQVRFKSSPMGRWSHGHEPHNSFTLTAYGEPLLVNNVYRDIYGSPFHKDWVWSTRAQNAVLVNGEGQKAHSADLGGAIRAAELRDGMDYVVGDATAAYEGKLQRAVRHVVFVKPDVIVIADELGAAQPSTYQFMLHGQAPFTLDEAKQRLVLEREKSGLVVDYVPESPLKFRQWTGYSPEPDKKYLLSINRPMIPDQWHVEASTQSASRGSLMFTVLRPYRKGERPEWPVEMERTEGGIRMTVRGAGNVPVVMQSSRDSVQIQKGDRQWKIDRIP
ncbi:MAG: DUF4962 domain-containing protein [Bryobacterales bacterium]|nr:DUF4962 domain-containing protein [Bryobacterales bacterium]